ncbi:MAG: geranylgeranyl reductase family protein [Candidatus Aenigmarchaeota archaeon]|nr:geranylgeranyl reductase family protein [Candidatus Aenigmarchaeota archaeon]
MPFDVIVIGGGPAGATAAMYLGKSGKRVLLVDKVAFPRDKTCGDAQGRKAAAIMKELGIYEEYTKLPGQEIYGITLSSPNGMQVELDVESRNNPAPGYVHKRMVFDNFLFQSAKKWAETRVFEVTDLVVEEGTVRGVVGVNENGETETIRAGLVLAADGALSIVARKFGFNKNPPEHFIAALRAYYKNVDGMTDRIEIHMIKSLIPGYFWVFPLPNREANVGLGMVINDMNKKKINLKEAMLAELKENPLFKERFKNARLDGEIRAWNLPLASYHRTCYGSGFLVLGDAASLIDPLSGEGVGTAMISGRVAALVTIEALQKNDFSERFLKKYDAMLWDVIGDEIRADYRLQRLGTMFPHLIDRVVEKALKDEGFRKKLESKLPYTGGRHDLGEHDFIFELDPSLDWKQVGLEA